MQELVNQEKQETAHFLSPRHQAEDEKRKKALMSLFHKSWLGFIKKSLGSDCTFISHVSAMVKGEEQYLIKVCLRNETGGRDKVTYNVGTHFDNITEKYYETLLQRIKNRDYKDEGSEAILPSTEE